MLSSLLLTLSIVLLANVPVQAALQKSECADEDVSARLGPVRTQGPDGLCYAFVAADLLTFHNHLLGGRRISVKDVALNYMTSNKLELDSAIQQAYNPTIQSEYKKDAIPFYGVNLNAMDGLPYRDRIGGDPAVAMLLYSRRGGFCTDNELESETPEQLRYLEYSKPHLSQGLPRPTKSDAAREFYELTGLPCPTSQMPWLNGFADFRAQMNNGIVRMMNQNANLICSPRKPLKPFIVTTGAHRPGPTSKASKVAASILKMKQPIGIGFNHKFLKDANTKVATHGDHAASIVGSRWNANQKRCEFKLRNSWGPYCSHYHKSFEKNCDRGNVWITEDQLNNNTFHLYGVFDN